jgi:3-(3-hydroxy-phenyl)propionate hydroxylase
MLSTYHYPRYAYRRAPELDAGTTRRVPLVVIGAGPVGLAAAIDGALQGLPVLLLDDDNTVSVGSRGLCYAKRTLEILDRLGVGDAVVDKGVTWNVGRTFCGAREVFNFNLLPQSGHRRPGMVNLQQYWLEQYLVERAQQLRGIDLRWQHQVVNLQPHDGGTLVEVDTADGRYTLQADWVVVADGARSPMRRLLGLDVEGKVFQDRFLIADVVLHGELFPADRTERWFWFDPPFHSGQSVLLHREADNVWRIDFQLGWDADPEAEKAPERVIPRIRALLDRQGFSHIGFDLEWVSVYTFQCRRMKSFMHRRVCFVGDAAHQVSPFGARGANSGVQDADNLMWKLALVARGLASQSLLASYDSERTEAADENISNSTRSTDFITPKSRASRVLRRAVLGLAATHAGVRLLVNSGRLSVPTLHAASPLSTPDDDAWSGWMQPGAPADDAPLEGGGWLLQALGGGFVLLHFAGSLSAADQAAARRLAEGPIPIRTLRLPATGLAAERYGAREGSCVLVRPDQIVAARWRQLDERAVRQALAQATGHVEEEVSA